MGSRRFLIAALVALLLACSSPTDTPAATGDVPAAEAPTEAATSTSSDTGGAPTAEQPSGSESQGIDGASALQEVYDQLEGLEGEERTARLVELAGEEEGELSLYTAMNLDNAGPLADEYEDLYGFSVAVYRAFSDTIAARHEQEVAAGSPGADLVSMNAASLVPLDEDGLLLPLATPETDNLPASSVFPNWASTWINVFTVAWNPNNLPADQVPTTYEELLEFDGTVGWEATDEEWFGTLVLDYFVAQKGMTEEDAIELFRGAVDGVQFITGHTPIVEFLSTGELQISPHAYNHTVQQYMGRGAPLEWQPAVEPLIALPDGIGIAANTTRPAKALLFIDFMMNRGQEMLVDFGRTPASPNVGGGLPEGVEVINVNLDVLGKDRDKWLALYEEITQQ